MLEARSGQLHAPNDCTSSAPHLERAERIGVFWVLPAEPEWAELLIDGEEDRTLRATLIGCGSADDSAPHENRRVR